jgi:hypothetical protein
MKIKGIITIVFGLMLMAAGLFGFGFGEGGSAVAWGFILGGVALIGGVLLLNNNSVGIGVATLSCLGVIVLFGASFYQQRLAAEPARGLGWLLAIALVVLVVLFLRRGPGPRSRVHGHKNFPDQRGSGELP